MAHTYLAPLFAARRRVVGAVSGLDVPFQQHLAIPQAGHVPLEQKTEMLPRLALQVLAPCLLFTARHHMRWESHACHGREPTKLWVEATHCVQGPAPRRGYVAETQPAKEVADVAGRGAAVCEEQCAPQSRVVQMAIGAGAEPRHDGLQHSQAGAVMHARGGILQGGVLEEHGQQRERWACARVRHGRCVHEMHRGQEHGRHQRAVELVIEALEAREGRVVRQVWRGTQRTQPRVPEGGALGRDALARHTQHDPSE